MMYWPLFLCAALWSLSVARAHHVLCIFPVPSASHNHLAKGIVDALLDAGHKVTWGTPFPKKTANKNLRMIDLSVTKKIGEALDMTEQRNREAGIGLVKEFSRNISTAVLQTEELRQALVNEQFDAVVTEWFFNDVDAGFAAVQQVPWILLSGVPMHPHIEMLVDDIRTVATHPLMMNNFPVPMSLWQRLLNSIIFLFMTLDFWSSFSSSAALYDTHFGPLAAARGVSLPPYSSAIYNISVVLVNSHPSVVFAQSLPPNVVNIGGYHIDQNPPPLPKDLQDILDGSPQGVVYFSMGSVVKSASLPDHTQQALLKVFGSIPQTVLWKFEKELKNVPKNVHVRSWMPQASILAHPNIRVFITHGGLLSTLEAAHYGVPLLAVPIFGDQPSNADRSVRAGVARKVKFSHDMADELKVELAEMLNDNRYYKKAKEVSVLFNDRPVEPAKLISHYIRLAIDSKGAYHLRSPSKLYAWYEKWMLDQIAILLLVLYLLLSVVKKIFGFLRSKLVGSSKVKRH
nr:uridine diphosphate-glycosyltransferases 41G2 [Glyphodes pyloalis]